MIHTVCWSSIIIRHFFNKTERVMGWGEKCVLAVFYPDGEHSIHQPQQVAQVNQRQVADGKTDHVRWRMSSATFACLSEIFHTHECTLLTFTPPLSLPHSLVTATVRDCVQISSWFTLNMWHLFVELCVGSFLRVPRFSLSHPLFIVEPLSY